MLLIAADHIWHDGALHPAALIETDGARITGLHAAGSRPADRSVHLMMPACTDLQVNGGGGVMVNDAPHPGTLRRIAAAHRSVGTGWVMPTVITDAPEVMEAAAEAAIAVAGAPGQLGLHIEGPHINPVRRGTHAERFIRPLDEATMAVLRRLRNADVRTILTLAPELADPAAIVEIRAMGVVVSAGHSAANADQARAGLDAGVSMFTHLYNAMPPMLSRDPGLVGAAILSPAYTGIIADGIHVSWEALRIAIAARPVRGRVFLVSDAMATVAGPDHFILYGQQIEVRDGALVNSEGSLAGAHVDMVTGLRNLVHKAQIPLAEAIAMATDVPRAAIGLPPERGVAVGAPLGGLIALDHDLMLEEVF